VGITSQQAAAMPNPHPSPPWASLVVGIRATLLFSASAASEDVTAERHRERERQPK